MKKPRLFHFLDLMGLVAVLGVISCGNPNPIPGTGFPTVTSPTSASITNTIATLGANVTSDGGAAITERGVVFSITAANAGPIIDGIAVSKIATSGTTGVFTVNVTGLSPGTGYSFRAYAINADGYTASTDPVSTFTTTGSSPSPGTVDTVFAPNVAGFYAEAAAVQPDGKTVIGGEFTTVGGAAHLNVARLKADGSVDPTFTATADGGVYSAAVQADGQILIAGNFLNVNGTPRSRIARLNPDGTLESAATFDPGTGANDEVLTMAVQSDGQIVIGGFFTTVNGIALNNIARLNPDGSVESAATFNPGTGVENVPPGSPSSVKNLAVTAGGLIVIGGNFNTVDGSPRKFIARLNGDGSLETTATFDTGTGANSIVYAVAVQVDGQILIGGNFSAVDGSLHGRIARLNFDGSVESTATFNPGTGADGFAILGISLQTDGKILLGGDFDFVDGTARKNLARLHPDGSLDTTFDVGTGADDDVYTVVPQADGKVLLAGDFLTVNGAASPSFARLNNGPATQSLSTVDATHVKWLRSGAGPEFSAVTFEQSIDNGATWTPLGDAFPIAGSWDLTGLVLPNSGKLRARGRVATGKGSGLVELVADFDNALPAVSSPTSTSITSETATLGGDVTSGGLSAITVRGVVYSPTILNANPLLNGPAVFDEFLAGGTTGIFTVDATGLEPGITYSFKAYAQNAQGVSYSPVATFTTLGAPTVTSPTVAALAATSVTLGGNVISDGGAQITERGVMYGRGTAASAPPRLNSGSAVTKITASGTTGVFTVSITDLLPGTGYSFAAYAVNSVGTTYSTPVTSFTTAGAPPPGGGNRTWVQATAVQPDGKTIIGGFFDSAGGAAHTSLARLNMDGSVDASFTAGTNGGVYSVAVQADGKILLAGAFTAVNGAARNCFARLHADGTLEDTSTFQTGSGANSLVYTVAVQTDGKILLGGNFTMINGSGRDHIARLHADGSLESAATFNPGTGLNDGVYCLAVQADGKILAGGAFTTVDGLPRSRFARLLADGSLEDTATFDPGTGANDWVNCIAVQADGKILLGGGFTSFNSTTRNRIARLNTNGSLESTATFNPGTGADHTVYSVAVQTDGKILLGGSFQNVNGTARNRIARLNADGTLDNAGAFNPGTGADAEIDSVAVQADGEVLLGGGFTTVNGIARSLIARLGNDAATQSLTAPDATRVQWLRGGAGPEVLSVTFDLSTNGGTSWTALGAGTRIAGGWQLTGLSLPAQNYLVRARGRTTGGYLNASSGLVESVLNSNADSDSDDDGLLDSWEIARFGTIDGHSALDDFDRDGRVELLELAFDTNPLVPDADRFVAALENGYLTTTITKRLGVSYSVQTTAAPQTPGAFSATTTTVLIDNATTLKVRDNFLIPSARGRFLRVEIRPRF